MDMHQPAASRHEWKEEFGELMFRIVGDAYGRLPDESDDADIRRATEEAVDAANAAGRIGWDTVKAGVLPWTEPGNIYTNADAAKYLPTGFRDQVVALPNGMPADIASCREILVLAASLFLEPNVLIR